MLDLSGVDHEVDQFGFLLRPQHANQAITVLDQLAADEQYFCRGMEQNNWKVRCSLARHWESLGPGRHDIVMHEHRLLATFWGEAGDLIPAREFKRVRKYPFLQLAIAQHYGLPTRLVDWSWSPHRAALFAVLSRQIGWGVVWWISSAAANAAIDSRCSKLGKTRDPATGQWDYSDAFAANTPRYLLLVRDTTGFPRLRAQAGLFTFCSDYFADHVEMLAEMFSEAGFNPGEQMGRLLIPYDWKGEVRDQLEKRRIDSFRLDVSALDLAVQRVLMRVSEMFPASPRSGGNSV